MPRWSCIGKWGSIAVLLCLTACQGLLTPPQPTSSKRPVLLRPKATTRPASVAPSLSPSPSASPSATLSPTPTPMPSVALILTGAVTIDTRAILKAGMAEATATGVKLVGNNSAGLISDKGLGLISDKGLGLIGNNSGGLIGKTKYQVAQASDAAALTPVEGMLVEAVDLLTGKVAAGPVATNAAGEYKLGFLELPGVNLRIVARVNNTTDAKFAYSSLTKPDPAPIVTSDSTRAVTTYILAVMPMRLDPLIQAHKSGDPAAAEAELAQYGNATGSFVLKAFNAKLATVPKETLQELDADGKLAMGLSERMVAFADLSKAPYKQLLEHFEEVRKFDQSRPTPAEPSLVDQVIKLVQVKADDDKIIPLLTAAGMDTENAERLGNDILLAGNAIGDDLGTAAFNHQAEVLGPLKPYFGSGLF